MRKKGCCSPAPGSSARQHTEPLSANVALTPLIQNISIFKKKKGLHVCLSLAEATWKCSARARCWGGQSLPRDAGMLPVGCGIASFAAARANPCRVTAVRHVFEALCKHNGWPHLLCLVTSLQGSWGRTSSLGQYFSLAFPTLSK